MAEHEICDSMIGASPSSSEVGSAMANVRRDLTLLLDAPMLWTLSMLWPPPNRSPPSMPLPTPPLTPDELPTPPRSPRSPRPLRRSPPTPTAPVNWSRPAKPGGIPAPLSESTPEPPTCPNSDPSMPIWWLLPPSRSTSLPKYAFTKVPPPPPLTADDDGAGATFDSGEEEVGTKDDEDDDAGTIVELDAAADATVDDGIDNRDVVVDEVAEARDSEEFESDEELDEDAADEELDDLFEEPLVEFAAKRRAALFGEREPVLGSRSASFSSADRSAHMSSSTPRTANLPPPPKDEVRGDGAVVADVTVDATVGPKAGVREGDEELTEPTRCCCSFRDMMLVGHRCSGCGGCGCCLSSMLGVTVDRCCCWGWGCANCP